MNDKDMLRLMTLRKAYTTLHKEFVENNINKSENDEKSLYNVVTMLEDYLKENDMIQE
jgi:hypothetical protein